MAITTIIFDFGGVLVKWKPQNIFNSYFPGQPQAVDEFLEEIGFTQWNVEQDRGRSFADGAAILSAQHPKYSHIFQTFHEKWEASLDGQYDKSIELLRNLKDKGFPLYGLSNWSAETFPIARKRFGFFELFDDIIISGEVKLIKPDPQIFELCLSRIGRPASECLFIDDSEPNIQAAKKIGLDVIHFKSPEQMKQELQSRNLL